MRRARELAREFQGGLEDMAREVELDKVKDSLTAEIDPDGMVNTIKREIEDEIEAEIEDEWPDEATALDYLDEEPARAEASRRRGPKRKPRKPSRPRSLVETAEPVEAAEDGDALRPKRAMRKRRSPPGRGRARERSGRRDSRRTRRCRCSIT